MLILNYDLDSEMYLLNARHFDMGGAPPNPRLPLTKSFIPPYYPDNFAMENRRRIFQCESKDLVHWNDPRLILAPDDVDNLDDSLYGMAQYRVGNTWIGFVNVLHGVPDGMDVQLAYSVDGRRWKRVREPWLTVGPGGSWDQFMVEISCQPIEMGDELWFYYGGNGYGHHDWYSEWFREGLNISGDGCQQGWILPGLGKIASGWLLFFECRFCPGGHLHHSTGALRRNQRCDQRRMWPRRVHRCRGLEPGG